MIEQCLDLDRVPVDAHPPINHTATVRAQESRERVKAVRQAQLEDEDDASLDIRVVCKSVVPRGASVCAQQNDPPETRVDCGKEGGKLSEEDEISKRMYRLVVVLIQGWHCQPTVHDRNLVRESWVVCHE
jgi:hypothetical protein